MPKYPIESPGGNDTGAILLTNVPQLDRPTNATEPELDKRKKNTNAMDETRQVRENTTLRSETGNSTTRRWMRTKGFGIGQNDRSA